MSCYAIVRLPADIKASQEEMQEALKAMGLPYIAYQTSTGWTIPSYVGIQRLKKELARAKILSEARVQGYTQVREERQGDRIVIRMRA